VVTGGSSLKSAGSWRVQDRYALRSCARSLVIACVLVSEVSQEWLGESRTAGESAGGWGPASEDTDATAAVTSWSSLAEIQ
jgi:hypothetical protein